MGILTAIGIILFLYLNWRNLRDNYKQEELVSYSWLALISFFLGGRLFYGLLNWGIWNSEISNWFTFWNNKGFDLIGGYIFLLLISYFVAGYRDWKVWSLGEDSISNFLILVFFILIDRGIGSKFDLRDLLNLAVTGLVFGVSLYLKRKYRSFFWYKSGKKGFAFLSANFLALLLLSFVSILFKDNQIYSYLFLGGSLLSLIGLFILGDVWTIKK